MKLYNLALLAALAALAAPAPGCGNGSGAPAATGPVTSVPRTVDGITFTQSADKAVYAVGEPILITYGAAASNLSNGANFAATNALLPFIQGVAVAGATQLPLFGPAASGTDTGDTGWQTGGWTIYGARGTASGASALGHHLDRYRVRSRAQRTLQSRVALFGVV